MRLLAMPCRSAPIHADSQAAFGLGERSGVANRHKQAWHGKPIRGRMAAHVTATLESTKEEIMTFRIALASLALLAATLANAQQPAPPAADAAMPTAAAPVAGDHVMSGTAAWYGRKFAGRKTASGQRFNPHAMTAAHPTLAFGTRVKVTNTRNKRSVVVTINDRMNPSGRMLDVTQAAAKRLGFIRAGLADVTLEVVGNRRLKRARH